MQRRNSRLNPRTLAWTLLWAAIVIATLWQTSQLAGQYALQELRKHVVHTLNLVAENLRGELSKFKLQPQFLATNPRYAAVLRGQATETDVLEVNTELKRINTASGALDTYLMNASGLTIASSNWASPKPFVGLNFYYRPYFQEAMQGKLGRFLALGTTSDERGYYFASPVWDGERIIGAAVVKMQVSHFETLWRAPNQEIIVIDENNVVFLSTDPEWAYRAILPLTEEQRNQIRSNRKYSHMQIDTMPILKRGVEQSIGEVLVIGSLDARVGIKPTTEYLVETIKLADPEWRVLLLANTRVVEGQVRTATALAGGFIGSLALLAAYVLQRRRRTYDQLAYQQRTQEHLEERVTARTRELQEANEKLRSEVVERERAEDVLRRTQANLIQAAKLAALGQMSAGISHELNQPLAAVRSYADNARAYLERDQLDIAKSNLNEISELTERMARMIRHLRTYAREETVEARPTSVAAALRSAIGLLDARIKSENVVILQSIPSTDVMAMAGDVRLQQVLVNIIANAMDAMHGAIKQIHVTIQDEEDRVVIRIRDTGTGVHKEHLPNIFDPFFSTKRVGSGLGLGLSISDSIIRQFGGVIEAENAKEGGAMFTISLPRSDALGVDGHDGARDPCR